MWYSVGGSLKWGLPTGSLHSPCLVGMLLSWGSGLGCWIKPFAEVGRDGEGLGQLVLVHEVLLGLAPHLIHGSMIVLSPDFLL